MCISPSLDAPKTSRRLTLHCTSFEGMVFYYIHAMRLGWGTSVVETSPGALRLMLALQEDGDRELAQVGGRTWPGLGGYLLACGNALAST